MYLQAILPLRIYLKDQPHTHPVLTPVFSHIPITSPTFDMQGSADSEAVVDQLMVKLVTISRQGKPEAGKMLSKTVVKACQDPTFPSKSRKGKASLLRSPAAFLWFPSKFINGLFTWSWTNSVLALKYPRRGRVLYLYHSKSSITVTPGLLVN